MNESITRAEDLLLTARHAAMATVNADGSPHNSPFFFAYNTELTKIFWCSRTDAGHSKNIARTGKLFVVLYVAAEHATGLYIRAQGGRVAEGAEFDEAVESYTAARKRAGYPLFSKQDYAEAAPKLYAADIQEMWHNGWEQDEKGMVTRDFRVTVAAQDLLQ
jgi:hypothetical protein